MIIILIQTLNLKADDFKLNQIISGLNKPWSLTFKNQNEILITEKSGNILLVNFNNKKMDRINKIGLPVVLLIMFAIVGIMKSAVNIGYGEAGVLFRTFGEGTVVDEPALGEGFHIIAPWNKVYLYNVKQQEVFESQMQVLSSNGLIFFNDSPLEKNKKIKLDFDNEDLLEFDSTCSNFFTS